MFQNSAGEWTLRIYYDTISKHDQAVLVKGKVDCGDWVMVRMHQVNILSDVFFEANAFRTGELSRSMQLIAKHGAGVLVLLYEGT